MYGELGSFYLGVNELMFAYNSKDSIRRPCRPAASRHWMVVFAERFSPSSLN